MFFRPVYWVLALLTLLAGAGMVAYDVRAVWLGTVSSGVSSTTAHDIGGAGLVLMGAGFWFVRQARSPDES